MNQSNLKLLLVSADPKELVNMMKNYVPPVLDTKWRQLKMNI
jgi:hypothetical protein